MKSLSLLQVWLANIVILMAITGLGYLYINRTEVDLAESSLLILKVNSFENESVLWDREILKVNSGLVKNYDGLNLYEDLTIEYFERLEKSDVLKPYLSDLTKTIHRKKELSDLFRTEIAILRNSINYLPQLYDEIIKEDLLKDKQLELSIHNLFLATINFYENDSELEYSKVISALDIFEDELNRANLSAMTHKKNELFARHVLLVIKKRYELNTILNEISKLPIEQEVMDLGYVVRDAVEQQVLKQNDDNKTLTYYSAGLVFIIIVMAICLFLSYVRLQRLNKSLEHRVADRTKALSEALLELKSSEMMMRQSEKMSALGQLVAGVAHEINTPLAYTKNALDVISTNIVQFKVNEFITLAESLLMLDLSNGNVVSSDDFKKIITQYQMLRNDLNDMGLSEITYKELLEEQFTLIKDGVVGIEQITKLISNLRNFSRLDKGEVSLYSLKSAIESTLLLLRYELKNKEVYVNIEQDFVVECMPSQINQVLLNIVGNANHAIGDHGSITISLEKFGENYAGIVIADTGYGIDPSVISEIFNPFFTTKKVGEGTGLGLSISYKIIKEHRGEITVSSVIGQGTTFIIKLPFVKRTV